MSRIYDQWSHELQAEILAQIHEFKRYFPVTHDLVF